MKKFLLSFAILAITAISMNAQTYIQLKQAGAADTTIKSKTIFTQKVNVNSSLILQSLTMAVKADSISGTNDVRFFLQRSTDGVNWYSATGDTTTYTAVTTTATVKGGSKYKELTINPFNSKYARVGYFCGSGTQKAKVWISILSSNLK